MPIKTTSSIRKDESSRFQKGDFVRCIIPGEACERFGTIYEVRPLHGTAIVWIDSAGGFHEIQLEKIIKLAPNSVSQSL